MAERVAVELIEDLVGARRQARVHLGRAVSEEQTIYVLHSHACRDSGIDLVECEYSIALDQGVGAAVWDHAADRPVVLVVVGGRLLPARVAALEVEALAHDVEVDLELWQLEAIAVALAQLADGGHP